MKLKVNSINKLSGGFNATAGQDSKSRIFHSCDSRFDAEFSAPWELQMGATYYGELRIRPSDGEQTDVTEIPRFKEMRFFIPQCYQPWMYDSSSVLLLAYDNPPFLYNLQSSKVRRLQVKETLHSAALCSSDCNMAFLLNYGNIASFVSLNGDLRPSLSFPLAAQHTSAFWLDDYVLILRQERKPPRIQLYQMESSSPAADIAIDPAKIIPFDAEKYRKLKKTHSVLRWKSSLMSGTLLDMWGSAYFDRERMALYVSIMRPVGEPFMNGENEQGYRPELICDVEPIWVEIALEVQGHA